MDELKNMTATKKGIIILLVICIATGVYWLIFNPSGVNSSKKIAEEFLETYYTISDTNIADILFAPPDLDNVSEEDLFLDENMQGIVIFSDSDAAINDKYGEYFTEKELYRLKANRTLIAHEITAKNYETRFLIDTINIWNEESKDNGDIFYEYNVAGNVIFSDGEEEWVNLFGNMTMTKDENRWLINRFEPREKPLYEALSYGISNLTVRNESDFKIARIELDSSLISLGGMLADGEYISKGDSFTFDMIHEDNLEFTIRLIDKDKNVIHSQSFMEDFSKGRDVDYYILEDQDGNPVIRDKM